MLHPLLVKIWETEAVLEDWKKDLMKLHKEGDHAPFDNWESAV